MKTEVLKKIKEAEDDYRRIISGAEENRKKSISDAELEAENLLTKARHETEEYKARRISDARDAADTKYQEIIGDGEKHAEAIREQGTKNQKKAVDLLVARFREQLHVHS